MPAKCECPTRAFCEPDQVEPAVAVPELSYEIRYGLPTGCGRLAAAGVALPLHSRTGSLRLEVSRRDRIDSTSGSQHGWSRPAPGGPGTARRGPERREYLLVFGLGLSGADHDLGR